jgi:drug/metabolite transporter (DMT)-like permease
MVTQSTRPDQLPLRGIMLVLLACTLFACMDTAGKYLMTKFSVPLVASVRYGLHLIILTALMAPRHGQALWKTQRTRLVLLRGVSLSVATLFSGLALQLMPVGETVAIFYLQGFGVMLAAGYFLGERVSIVGWTGAIVGFAGVLLIARPGSALDPLGVVFALTCAAVSVVYVLLSRLLSTTESTMALLFYVAVAGVLVFGTLLLFNWQNYQYEWLDIALLLFMGAAALTAHFLFTAAYRFAPASLLAPFNYFHIALAVIISWLVYNHLPDLPALIGIAMIATSGATIAFYTHMTKFQES